MTRKNRWACMVAVTFLGVGFYSWQLSTANKRAALSLGTPLNAQSVSAGEQYFGAAPPCDCPSQGYNCAQKYGCGNCYRNSNIAACTNTVSWTNTAYAFGSAQPVSNTVCQNLYDYSSGQQALNAYCACVGMRGCTTSDGAMPCRQCGSGNSASETAMNAGLNCYNQATVPQVIQCIVQLCQNGTLYGQACIGYGT